MSKITVNELPTLTNPNFTTGDYFLVWDESTGQSCKFSVSQYRQDVLDFGLTGGNYNGTIDADLNSSIVLPSPANGDWFFVDVAGTIEGLDVEEHDIVKYNGTSWERVPRGIAVAASSRQTLLSTQSSIAADGEQPTVDPNGLPGWYYKNTTSGKINWYFYGGTGVFTETNYGNLATMWAVVTIENGYFYMQAYTKPTGSGDASWYKSRINWDDDTGQLLQNLTPGRYLVYTGEASHTAGVHPEIAAPNRIQLPESAAFSQGDADPTEEIWLLALSTSSGFAEGHNEFTVEEVGYQFGTQKHTMDLVGVQPNPEETDPLFSASFKGNFADATALNATTGTEGQWAINNATDSIWIYDDVNGWTEAVGAATAPSVPYPFVYSDTDGTGYGYMDATSVNGNNYWNNTPDGMLQTTAGNFENFNRVKFGTLKNPGDEVHLNGIPLNTYYIYRWSIVGISAGTDPSSVLASTSKAIGTGTSHYGTPSNAGNSFNGIELHNCFVRPYWGTSSYAGNMYAVGGANPSPLDSESMKIGYRVASDYHIEFLVDGEVRGRTVTVPSKGVDLYIQSPTGRRFPQPSGSLAAPPADNPDAGEAALPPGKYWMSQVGIPGGGNEVAQGGGYYLYSNDTAGDVSDIELTASEAGAAANCRVFIDYTDKNLEERAELTDPIVKADEDALAQVIRIVKGFYHSQDYDVPTIQAKMELWGDGLAAAAAGSVEVTLAIAQSLTIPTASGGTYEDFDPWHVTYSSSGTCDTRASFPAGTQMRDEYGITGARFYAPSPGSSLGQMEFYFATSADSTAWRSQDRTVQFNVPGSTEGFEGSFTVTTADQAYASGSQVTYSNPDSWGAADVAALALYTVNNFGTTDIQIALGAPVAQSPADALGEADVVAKVISDLSLHLAKFPR